MIEESKLIPYTTTDIPFGEWIVFAPHHDDETIGMGGSLILAKEQNIKITLVIVTDGSMGGNSSTRENEVKAVANKLGITELIFLRQKDRDINFDDNLIQNIADIIDDSNANTVFAPSSMELHPDHRMTTELVWSALKRTKNRPDFYTYEISVQSQINYLVDITKVMPQKKSLLSLYASQLEQNNYMDLMVSMNRLRTYTLPENIAYAEGFYYYGNEHDMDYRAQLISDIEPYTQQHFFEKYGEVDLNKLDFSKSTKSSADTLVSVIMPCFNDGAYLAEAIDSVLNQTYKNIEIIIANDASTDIGTVNILKELKISGIKVIDLETNSGPSVARNRAISMAKGKYILALDADDKIAPTYIKKAKEILDNYEEIGIVYCEAECFGRENKKWDLQKYSFPEILISNMIFVTAMHRKKDWESVGGYNENMINGFEDHDFWLSILELGREVYMINETLFSYRIKDVSRTSKLMSNYDNIQKSQVQIFKNHQQLYIDNIKVFFDEIGKKQVAEQKNLAMQLSIDGHKLVIDKQKLAVSHLERTVAAQNIIMDEQKIHILYLKDVAESMRLGSRLKRVARKITPKGLWIVLKLS